MPLRKVGAGATAVAVILLGVLGLAWAFGSAMTARHDVPASPLPPGARHVDLRADDGIPIAGNYWPSADPQAPSVLLLHGLNGSRQQLDRLAIYLAARDYAVLAINLRAHGDSGGDTRSFGLYEARDCRAGFDWLKRTRPGTRVGVFGLSLGGAAALLGDKGPVPADALVLTVVFSDIRHAIRSRMIEFLGQPAGMVAEPMLSYQAPLRFGVWPDALSPITAVRSYHGPVFVIGGARDRYTPPAETRALYQAANAPKQLWIVPGAGHSEADSAPDFAPRVAAFLDRWLKQAPTGPLQRP